MQYPEFFASLTGFPPYPWQERLEADLRRGNSVILRVPTGAGKTWGAVGPFLQGMKTGNKLADRLLYVLPLRSLASSLHATVLRQMTVVLDDVSATGKDRPYGTNSRHCSLQIGGQKNDPFFESDLVFTTIDQLLSGYIFLPVSLPDRVGNINAGSLIGSLLVFDELHLLDPRVALATTIEMLDRLKGLSQFVLMTATMSDQAMQVLAAKVRATVVRVPDDEIALLPAQRTKQRTWRYTETEMTPSAIRSSHTGGRTIALVNTVRRAQDLFMGLESLTAAESHPPELLLLHSRFYSEDRLQIESKLDRYFGPNAERTNIILVTTQVIEAGMELSADHLHTEIAPMNALIQRAGRTARYESRNVGFVSVYEAPTLHPYGKEADAVNRTRVELLRLPAEGSAVDFRAELAWIEAVHSGAETQAIRANSHFQRRRSVAEAMDFGDRGKLTELVRDISSIAVLISDHPEQLDFGGRAWPRLLSVSPDALMALAAHVTNAPPGSWVAKGAQEQDIEGQRLSLNWTTLTAQQLRGQWLIALHPDFALYSKRLGLVLGLGAPPDPVQMSEPAPILRYQYEFEPWSLHAERIAVQARGMRNSYERAAVLLANYYNVPPEAIEELSEVVCILHDVGKLGEEWQRRAWLWQNDKDSRMRALGYEVPIRSKVPLAHTWFDTVADREFQRQSKYSLPHHAGEGAWAVSEGMFSILRNNHPAWGDVAAASACSAIARHHSPRSSDFQPFRLSDKAQTSVTAALPGHWRGLELKSGELRTDAASFAQELLKFSREEDECAWPLYTFLVRRLRLADQASLRSTKRHTSPL